MCKHVKEGTKKVKARKMCENCYQKWWSENRQTTTSKKRKARKRDEWKKANPEKAALHQFKAMLKWKYNITLEQYLEAKDRQRNRCAICGAPPKNYRLHIDHDHETKVFRGLLCVRCNTNLTWYTKFQTETQNYLDRVKKEAT